VRKIACDGCKKEIEVDQASPSDAARNIITVAASIGKIHAEADACSPACWAGALAVASRDAQKFAESDP
jgi:hypothetical protein